MSKKREEEKKEAKIREAERKVKKPAAVNKTCSKFKSDTLGIDFRSKTNTGIACKVNGKWQVQ